MSTARATANRPGLDHELHFWQAEMRLVAGVDEVGRGALAGPLVAAAVILPCCVGPALARLKRQLAGVRDSKQLTPLARERLVEPIRAVAVAVGVGAVEADEIDELGIAAGNRLAMERAVLSLSLEPDALLLDACTVDLPLPQVGPIDADARSLTVAAASIVAKVTRDRFMAGADETDPRYGFALHKGYGSAMHLARLHEHGPGPLHRRSFAPVGECLRRWP